MLKKYDSSIAPSEIINAIHTLYKDGREKELLTRLVKLRDIYPNSSEIYNIMGAIAVEKNFIVEAIFNFKKAVELDNSNPDYYNNLGAALTNVSEFNQAEQVLIKAIELDPIYENAYNNLGNIYIKSKKRHEEAIVAYKKAIEINPNYFEAYNNLGNILGKIGETRNAELNLK